MNFQKTIAIFLDIFVIPARDAETPETFHQKCVSRIPDKFLKDQLYYEKSTLKNAKMLAEMWLNFQLPSGAKVCESNFDFGSFLPKDA